MTTSKTNRTDLFQDQLKNFKALLSGSKMAEVSSIILAVFSVGTAFISRNNLEQAIPLLLGALAQIIYTIKYLQTNNIKQKSYTQTSLNSGVLKFKQYILKREKYEMPVMAFYMITLVPFALRYKSITIVISVCLISLALVSFLGFLAFKKVDSNIELLEITLKNKLQ